MISDDSAAPGLEQITLYLISGERPNQLPRDRPLLCTTRPLTLDFRAQSCELCRSHRPALPSRIRVYLALNKKRGCLRKKFGLPSPVQLYLCLALFVLVRCSRAQNPFEIVLPAPRSVDGTLAFRIEPFLAAVAVDDSSACNFSGGGLASIAVRKSETIHDVSGTEPAARSTAPAVCASIDGGGPSDHPHSITPLALAHNRFAKARSARLIARHTSATAVQPSDAVTGASAVCDPEVQHIAFPPSPLLFALPRHSMSGEVVSSPARSAIDTKEYDSSPLLTPEPNLTLCLANLLSDKSSSFSPLQNSGGSRGF